MTFRGRRSRLAILLWAVLNMALPGATTIIDAIAGGEISPRSHIEETSGSACARVHSDDCGLCRYLVIAVGDGQASRNTFVVTEKQAVVTTQEWGCPVELRIPLRARAPPVS